ncbi:MAG: hypothetical protein P4L46_19910 [Fimbriimonas sp.]|nr:hypothetical protein [Fimbriimonas sp.]
MVFMNKKSLVALGALVTVVSPAFAQQPTPPSASFGPSIGIFMPSSSEIRKDLGSGAFQIGFGATGVSRPSEGSITPSLSLIVAKGNSNSLYIVPYTFGYEYHFGVDNSSEFLPYIRPFAGVAYYDYSITDTAGSHFGVKRLGGTAGLEAGFQIGSKIRVSAKYNFFTPSSGFDFDGLSLSATYALFSL